MSKVLVPVAAVAGLAALVGWFGWMSATAIGETPPVDHSLRGALHSAFAATGDCENCPRLVAPAYWTPALGQWRPAACAHGSSLAVQVRGLNAAGRTVVGDDRDNCPGADESCFGRSFQKAALSAACPEAPCDPTLEAADRSLAESLAEIEGLRRERASQTWHGTILFSGVLGDHEFARALRVVAQRLSGAPSVGGCANACPGAGCPTAGGFAVQSCAGECPADCPQACPAAAAVAETMGGSGCAGSRQTRNFTDAIAVGAARACAGEGCPAPGCSTYGPPQVCSEPMFANPDEALVALLRQAARKLAERSHDAEEANDPATADRLSQLATQLRFEARAAAGTPVFGPGPGFSFGPAMGPVMSGPLPIPFFTTPAPLALPPVPGATFGPAGVPPPAAPQPGCLGNSPPNMEDLQFEYLLPFGGARQPAQGDAVPASAEEELPPPAPVTNAANAVAPPAATESQDPIRAAMTELWKRFWQ